MPMCPNGCGINHRNGPTLTNCTNYIMSNRSVGGDNIPSSLKPKSNTGMAERYARRASASQKNP